MITCIFGLPGAGKTLALTRIAQKALRQGRDVYTNYYCEGCRRFDVSDIGYADFTGALILIDEITLLWDSRSFKTFEKAVKDFFVLHRHYDIDIIYATQYYQNCDKRIRDVTADTYLVRKGLFFVTLTRIPPAIKIPEDTGEILVGFTQPTMIDKLLKQRVFKRAWYKYYDTKEREDYEFTPSAGQARWSFPCSRKYVRRFYPYFLYRAYAWIRRQSIRLFVFSR